MVALLALLWAIEFVDLATDHALLARGLRPRRLDGLIGVLASPFLHAGIGHLASNSLPFVLLGWFAMSGGFADWLAATAIIVVGGGLATWLVAPSGLIVGASGAVMGWLGYLLARAAFSRRLSAIALAAVTLIYFGTLLRGMLPTVAHGVSWQGHLCGFAAGILAGWILHARPMARAAGSSGALP
jgi:membrane associated rhomboid family serine protease